MIYTLDTNILLRLANDRDPQHDSAKAAIATLSARGIATVLFPQAVYEFWVVATRPTNYNGLGYQPNAAKAAIVHWRQSLHLMDDDSGVYTLWLDLVDRYSVSGKPAHDARLVAAMIKHDIDRLLTFNDAGFKRYTEITAESPLVLRFP